MLRLLLVLLPLLLPRLPRLAAAECTTDGECWAPLQVLQPSAGLDLATYGSAVAVAREGEVLVAGCLQNRGGAVVDVLRLDLEQGAPGIWASAQRLVLDGECAGGDALDPPLQLDADADVAIVGLPMANRAAVLARDPRTGEWRSEQTLTPSTATAEDLYGFRVATAGRVVAVLGGNLGRLDLYVRGSSSGSSSSPWSPLQPAVDLSFVGESVAEVAMTLRKRGSDQQQLLLAFARKRIGTETGSQGQFVNVFELLPDKPSPSRKHLFSLSSPRGPLGAGLAFVGEQHVLVSGGGPSTASAFRIDEQTSTPDLLRSDVPSSEGGGGDFAFQLGAPRLADGATLIRGPRINGEPMQTNVEVHDLVAGVWFKSPTIAQPVTCLQSEDWGAALASSGAFGFVAAPLSNKVFVYALRLTLAEAEAIRVANQYLCEQRPTLAPTRRPTASPSQAPTTQGPTASPTPGPPTSPAAMAATAAASACAVGVAAAAMAARRRLGWVCGAHKLRVLLLHGGGLDKAMLLREWLAQADVDVALPDVKSTSPSELAAAALAADAVLLLLEKGTVDDARVMDVVRVAMRDGKRLVLVHERGYDFASSLPLATVLFTLIESIELASRQLVGRRNITLARIVARLRAAPSQVDYGSALSVDSDNSSPV